LEVPTDGYCREDPAARAEEEESALEQQLFDGERAITIAEAELTAARTVAEEVLTEAAQDPTDEEAAAEAATAVQLVTDKELAVDAAKATSKANAEAAANAIRKACVQCVAKNDVLLCGTATDHARVMKQGLWQKEVAKIMTDRCVQFTMRTCVLARRERGGGGG
jgi:hypothetical protein